MAFTDGGTNGQTPSVNAGTDTVVSGPAIDGNDWRTRSLFAYGPPTFPDQAPTASATASCQALTCSFDGTASHDPDGTVASYAWTFSDGGTATGATPAHGFSTPGTYTYTLTVTDNQGVASAPFQGTVNATPLNNPIAFTAAAHAYAASGTSLSVPIPGGVNAGDTMLLFVTTSNSTANAIATPSGWTQVATQNSSPLQAAVFEQTAGANSAGSNVTANVSSSGPIAAELVDYANVASGTPVTNGAADSNRTTHTAPFVPVTVGGSWVVNFWTDKSSSTTSWTLPNGLTQRDQVVGAGSGHLTGVVADNAGPLGSGSYPAQTASVGTTASGKAAMISLVLAPAG
jgi:PKD repeat protein